MPLSPIGGPVYRFADREGDSGRVRATVAHRRPCRYCDWNKAFPTVAKALMARQEHERATHGRPLH